ncbi:MarR family winged helix-turn-helix transcriptional regulator [Lignipirellula cremea]|uniref:Transcriptional regulator SlyA n=1 Tax=Lignipirellula cremea TaxID=2528010 RepID=A0A518DME6_9BACT|nr:MarR family transcriptional regulator [Lignipirellula cremea]QDU93014.1 Transcriptional regulator SlyA [Lignipirellula cremea]
MLEYDFRNSIGYWLITTAHAYQRAINEELAPQGITYRQCQTLGYLALEGPLSQNELAQRMQIEPPTLVGVLDRMERDGWIRRDVCPTDRRRKLIQPLQGAEPVWQTIIECALRVRAHASTGLTPCELDLLKSLLEKVQTNLQCNLTLEGSP